MSGKKDPRGTISTYRPGLVERGLDATLGAGTRQLQRLMGSSERDAQVEGSRVMNNFEELFGLLRGERAARNIGRNGGTPRDYLDVGLAALPFAPAGRVGRRVALAADEALLGQRMANHVVPSPNPAAKASILEGRALTSPEQVTHAQRNISTAELEDTLKRGWFNAPAQGSKHSETPAKWWSAADEKGVFGRTWAKGEHTVRVPAGKVTPGRAVSAKHAEIYDPATKQWLPLRTYAKKYAIGGVVIDDGNPAKQRKLI